MKTPSQRQFAAGLLLSLAAASSWSFVPSTQPPESTAVPGNVMLALSVEFPTGLQVSYDTTNYNNLLKYEGYFDNRKCYTYDTTNEVFNPTSAITATDTCENAEWNGNLLNWLTMTNLDQFRSVMTGGTRDNFSSKNASHPGDTTARTVLIRSFSDRNSYNPIKRIRTTDPIPSTLRSATAKYVRSGGYGSKFLVSNSNNFADLDAAQQRATCASTTLPSTGVCFNIRVSACVSSAAQGVTGNTREANCQARYSGVAKPEGLIQEYANTLRFAAFGYLNQTGNDRNGGVLRSAMKSVGPVAATSTGVIPNPNAEWNTTTGVILANPDPTDATASSVSNSGLMNYLNKFGYAAGYKGNDPVSELYYAAQRYMRGYALPDSYTNNLTDAYKDGFPVITGSAHARGGSRDPMINTCQRNFLLGIGDIYTHQDGQLPGRTGGPSDPDSLNVETLWTTLTTQEGSTSWTGGSSGGTPYMAALAHWANTNDIRSDKTGTQTMATYWVDVLENGNGVGGMPGSGTLRTQYWLAAKYGGFDTDPDTTNAPGTDPNIRTDATQPYAWDKNGDGVPDNWFAGSTPTSLKAGLSAAFSKINSEAGAASASSAAVTSSRQTSNSEIIYAGYNAREWTGSVRSCTPAQTAAECASNPTWNASNWLDRDSTVVPTANKLTTATRKIFTSFRNATTPFAFSSMAFKWNSLNATQQGVLNADGNGENRVEFLRGSRTHESTLFRTRPSNLLGDVVNSGVTYLAGAGPALTGANFPGHATYRNTTRTRPAVVYVGGNDGMLHALSGTDGRELFGYIPGSLLGKLNGLSDFNFRHQYFVDSTPMVGDFERTGSTAAAPNWGTMLVGGLGGGGKGYYALDISSQSTFSTSSEAALAAALPMWEFTSVQDPDLGFTFNEPSIHPVTGSYRQIAKMADATVATGVWRVVVGNGYGASGMSAATSGRAVLFMLNANTGAAETKLTADTTGANGLSTPTPVDTDRDGLMDTVYAGDLKGNLHKFQFSKADGADFVLARPAETGGAWRYLGRVYSIPQGTSPATAEAITTAPSVVPSCEGVGFNVLFGSGKLSEDADYGDNTARGFYNVVDRSPSSSLTVPTSDVEPIGAFTEAAIGSTGLIGRSWTTPNLSGKRGWRMSFSNGERVLTNSTLPPDTGAVLFATTRPTGDVCTPGNSGFLMAVNICSGRTGDLLVNGVAVGGLAIDSSGIVKVSNTYTNQNNQQTVVCNQDGCKGVNAPTLLGTSAPRGRYTWRELLTK
ncbi:pilus assembly protein [Hydrogenophaga sp.]|uniref:pilus assembly protein n=1 Tax=Hydrogenophaga sp. TaxID=1904254 RepID=UPI003D096CB4